MTNGMHCRKTLESENEIMRDRKCPICGSKEKRLLDSIRLINFDDKAGIFDNQEMVICRRCGGVYHEGIDMSLLDDYYSSYTGDGQIKAMSDEEIVLNNNMADFVEHFIKAPKTAQLLDVGCGYGWVMKLLKERGYENVNGIDTDESLMKELRSKGLSVEAGSIYSKKLYHHKFDVILLKMVLEHLDNPREAVENLREWLKKDGILIIEVPDCSLYDCTAFFRGYFQSVNMEHINNFSAVSLMNLMNNWRMLACESTESQGIFPVLRMAFRYEEDYERKIVYCNEDERSIAKSLNISSKNGKAVDEKIAALKNKEIIIWGVSPYTRGLLTYTELRDMNIFCFVDKNEFLQKKTLLGKKIIPPEELQEFEGRGVIVISGKNSAKAIIRNIRELNYKNEVVVLSDI